MQCKEYVHVHAFKKKIFFTCFTLFSKADVRSTFDIRQKVQLYLKSSVQNLLRQRYMQKQDLRKQHGITDAENALLHLPMNLHRHAYHSVFISARGTPLEVLHTLLLGPYKYLLWATMAKLSKKKNNALSCLLFCLHFHHLASPVESQETLQSISSLLLVGILSMFNGTYPVVQ